MIGTTNFQPQLFQLKNKSKSNSNISNNLVKSNYMSDENDTSNLNKFNKSSAFTLLQDLKLPENSNEKEISRGRFQKYLPHHTSPLWFEGFIWRGVYLKMYSRVEGKRIKAEIKALKNLAVEYLQTESSFKLDFQNIMKEKMNENSFLDVNFKTDQTHGAFKYVNFILPLICFVESPSWVLLGSPIIYNKRNGNEDVKIMDPASYFKRSLYLNNLSNNNLKFHFANFEENSTVFQTPNSSTSWVNSNNLNSIINNVKNLIPKHDPVCLMYLINQDPNTNIVYFDTPEYLLNN